MTEASVPLPDGCDETCRVMAEAGWHRPLDEQVRTKAAEWNLRDRIVMAVGGRL